MCKRGIALDLVQKLCDGLKATHYNQENEVDKIVEGMCVHYKVHDVHPTLQSDDLMKKKGIQLSSSYTFSTLYISYLVKKESVINILSHNNHQILYDKNAY